MTVPYCRTQRLRAALVAASLFAFVSPVWAQISGAPGPGSSYYLADLQQVPDFAAGDAGDFDGDLLLDAALTSFGELAVLFAPSAYDVFELAGIDNVEDLAVLRNDVGPDEIVTVGSGGVLVTSWSGISFETTQALAWTQGLRLDRVEVPQGTGREFVASDGSSLYRLSEDPVTGVWTRASFYSVGPTEVIVDHVVLEIDSDQPGEEIAILLADGIRIVSAMGVDTLTRTYPVTTTAIAALPRDDPEEEEGLVFTAVGPGGMGYIVSLNKGGQVGFDHLLGDPGVVAVAGGDVFSTGLGSGDEGEADVAVSYTADNSILFLKNGGSLGFPSITRAAGIQVNPVGPAGPVPQNRATPILADWDCDGDVDCLFPAEDGFNGHFYMYLNPAIAEDDQKPRIVESSYELSGGNTIRFAVDIVVTQDSVEDTGATHLELATYFKASPDPSDLVPVDPFYYRTLDLNNPTSISPDGEELHFVRKITLLDTSPVSSCAFFPSLYFPVMRLVTKSGGAVTKRRATRIYGIHDGRDEANRDFLMEHGGNAFIALTIDDGCPETWPPEEDELLDSGGLPCLPGPTSGGPPNTGMP